MLLKTKPILILFVAMTLAGVSRAEQAASDIKDKASYSIGVNLGIQLGKTREDINLDKFIEGLKDAFAGNEPKMTKEEMNKALAAFRDEQQRKQQQKRMDQASRNKAEGEAFLAANKKKQGIVTLPSGLQYQVIRAGKGETPKQSDTVVTHYHGTLINGEVFDSSVERGQPATFPVSGVIKGWTEALQKMKVGAKWKVFVPAELAYGANGAGAKIGPNKTLIFDIELLEIKK